MSSISFGSVVTMHVAINNDRNITHCTYRIFQWGDGVPQNKRGGMFQNNLHCLTLVGSNPIPQCCVNLILLRHVIQAKVASMYTPVKKPG